MKILTTYLCTDCRQMWQQPMPSPGKWLSLNEPHGITPQFEYLKVTKPWKLCDSYTFGSLHNARFLAHLSNTPVVGKRL
jgi:hypothetical protein